jgi:hypothetical protein
MGSSSRAPFVKKTVQPPVLVVVEEGDASAHGLDQVLVRGRGALVLEVDPERRRDLGELHLGRGAAAASSRAASMALHPSRRFSTMPFVSWTTKRWWAGRSLNVSFRPEGQATSREVRGRGPSQPEVEAQIALRVVAPSAHDLADLGVPRRR